MSDTEQTQQPDPIPEAEESTQNAPTGAPSPTQPYPPGYMPYGNGQSGPAGMPYGAGQGGPNGAPYRTGPVGPNGEPYGYGPGQQPPMAGGYGYGPSPQPPRKRKIWPWVVLIVVVVIIFGIFASCTVNTLWQAQQMISSLPSTSSTQPPSESRSQQYQSPSTSNSQPSTDSEFTYEEITNIFGTTTGSTDGTNYGAGVYRVGTDGPTPGLYYLSGSQTTESQFHLFDYDDDNGKYEFEVSVSYFGNYFAPLENGDLIVYEPMVDGATMHLAPNTSITDGTPYLSGCYRVGIDIPAGTYEVVAEEQSITASSGESAAYVMKDLDFDDDSIVDTKFVRLGGRQIITVQDGQYLELYAAQATPSTGDAGSSASPSAGSGQGSQSYSHHPDDHHDFS